MTTRDSIALAARLALLETLLAEILVRAAGTTSDPKAWVDEVRAVALETLRFRIVPPPGLSAEQSEVALAVQTEAIAFAERWFARLADAAQRTR